MLGSVVVTGVEVVVYYQQQFQLEEFSVANWSLDRLSRGMKRSKCRRVIRERIKEKNDTGIIMIISSAFSYNQTNFSKMSRSQHNF